MELGRGRDDRGMRISRLKRRTRLQAYDGDKALPGSAEQYFLEQYFLGPIPRLARRIRSLIFSES